jgi:methylmalonyl-CoA mutase cobalamin-binding subunit
VETAGTADAKRRRFIQHYGLTAHNAGGLVAEQALNRAGLTIAASPVSGAIDAAVANVLAA